MAGTSQRAMRIAIEGCCHGELDAIYASLQEAEAKTASKVDLLLICGDFQAIRNPADLKCLAVPDKYRQLGGFHKYYSGEAVAPVLTIVIGGNHEASNYMWELYHGGWIAPSIYYLGGAGSLLVNGLRISGASGIFNDRNYQSGHFETLPYSDSTMRSIYHIRQYDVFRLVQLQRNRPDIFLSHDWPLNIDKYGNTGSLIRFKPFFADEIHRNALGSPPLMHLLQTLKPPLWFAAHLHAKFAALVKHDNSPTIIKSRQQQPRLSSQPNNPDAIELDGLSDDESTSKPAANPDAIDISMDSDDERQNPSIPMSNPDAINLEIDETSDTDVPPTIAVEAKSEGMDKLIQADAARDESIELKKAKEALLRSLDAIPDHPIEKADEEVLKTEVEVTASEPKLEAKEIPKTSLDDTVTKFLALSKCGHRKQFLQAGEQLMELPHLMSNDAPVQLTFDPLWLAITRAFHPHLSLSRHQLPLPQDQAQVDALLEKETEWVTSNLQDAGKVPVESIQQFVKTAPSTSDPGGMDAINPPAYNNPQTANLMKFLQLDNKINASA